jgi:hypothetical protein
MRDVAKRMDEVVKKGQAQNWSQEQYRAGLRSILAECRHELRSGNVALNVKQRPWAK